MAHAAGELRLSNAGKARGHAGLGVKLEAGNIKLLRANR